MPRSSLQWEMILTELADIAGSEHLTTLTQDKFAYGVDYF